MSLYIRVCLINLLLPFLLSDSGGSFELYVSGGDVNVLGQSLAKICHWKYVPHDGSKAVASWNKHYESCEDALVDVQKKHHMQLDGLVLSLGGSSDGFIWYRPEYRAVSSYKKQFTSWLSAKVVKTYGFFEESGLIFIHADKRSVLEVLDVPPKQIHLRAVLWIMDQSMQYHVGMSPEAMMHQPFDQFLDHLHLMQGKGVVRVLAQPELYMVNQKKSLVYSGEEIPYASVDSKRTQILFKKALLSLSAQAIHIGDKGASLDVEITFDKASENQYHGNVGIARQMVKSSLRLPFYTSRVMGGVKQHRSSLQKRCVPFVSAVPVVGAMFCESSQLERQSMLYVMLMITPVLENGG